MTEHSTNSVGAARRAVVVTGASSGIGRAFAYVAAAEGATVVLIARSVDALAETAEEVRRRGGMPFVLPLDLTRPEAGGVVERFLAMEGLACDVLVNNAGFGLYGAAADLAREDQLGLLDLNVRALSDLALRFLPGMIARGRGGIINIASVAGFVPGPYMALYYASKAFVLSFSDALREETRGTGVAVTCVAPGPVDTKFFARSGAGRAKIFRMMPRASAASVARRGWAGFRRGKRLVIPGLLPWLSAWTAGLVPRPLLLSAVGWLQRRRGRA